MVGSTLMNRKRGWALIVVGALVGLGVVVSLPDLAHWPDPLPTEAGNIVLSIVCIVGGISDLFLGQAWRRVGDTVILGLAGSLLLIAATFWADVFEHLLGAKRGSLLTSMVIALILTLIFYKVSWWMIGSIQTTRRTR
ncbi:hypothetical protein ACFL6C_08870 [Myxococcota bacterium]